MYKNKYLKRFRIIHSKLWINGITNETTVGLHALVFFFRDSMIHQNSN